MTQPGEEQRLVPAELASPEPPKSWRDVSPDQMNFDSSPETRRGVKEHGDYRNAPYIPEIPARLF